MANSSTENQNGDVSTTIRVYAWFLKTFRGFHLSSVHRLPKQNFFGQIYYKTSWLLSKDEQDDGR